TGPRPGRASSYGDRTPSCPARPVQIEVHGKKGVCTVYNSRRFVKKVDPREVSHLHDPKKNWGAPVAWCPRRRVAVSRPAQPTDLTLQASNWKFGLLTSSKSTGSATSRP